MNCVGAHRQPARRDEQSTTLPLSIRVNLKHASIHWILVTFRDEPGRAARITVRDPCTLPMLVRKKEESVCMPHKQANAC